MGRQGMNFASRQSPLLTAHARVETGISLTWEVTPQQKWPFFEIKEKASKRKSSKVLEKESQLSSNKKSIATFSAAGTEWFVLEKQRSVSAYCKRYTLLPRNSYRCYDMLTHKSNTTGTAEDTYFSFPWLRLLTPPPKPHLSASPLLRGSEIQH